MSKDIININSEGKYHGYQERYWDDGELFFKGSINNDGPIDYWEYYWAGKLEKRFWI